MPDAPSYDAVLQALSQGDAQAATRLVREALADAERSHDLEAAARHHLALVGLARLGGTPGAGARELRVLEQAAHQHPGTALETAHDLAQARFLLDAGDAPRALAALRTAMLRQASGVGVDLSGAVLADLLVGAARERVTRPDLAEDLAGAVLALVPPEARGPALDAFSAMTGLTGSLAPQGDAGADVDPTRACWSALAATAAAVRANELERARRLLLQARRHAVAAREALGYSLASLLLFLVQVASAQPVEAVATALRAKASLDDLLGPGGGDEFKALLEMWREAVGAATFDGYVRAFVLARQAETL